MCGNAGSAGNAGRGRRGWQRRCCPLSLLPIHFLSLIRLIMNGNFRADPRVCSGNPGPIQLLTTPAPMPRLLPPSVHTVHTVHTRTNIYIAVYGLLTAAVMRFVQSQEGGGEEKGWEREAEWGRGGQGGGRRVRGQKRPPPPHSGGTSSSAIPERFGSDSGAIWEQSDR